MQDIKCENPGISVFRISKSEIRELVYGFKQHSDNLPSGNKCGTDEHQGYSF